MVYKKTINNKLVIVNILESGSLILKRKHDFLRKNYRGSKFNLVSNKLKSNSLNTYLSVKVVDKARVFYKYEELHHTTSISELLEVLKLSFLKQEQFEVCEILKIILNKIEY